MSGVPFFSTKAIRCRITLGEGGREKIVEGLATEVHIEKPGLPDMNKASITIRGMRLEDMDELTFLAFEPREMRNNRINVEAGEGNALAQVFAGEITSAYADFNAAPDVQFRIEAMSGFYPSLIPDPAISYQGEKSMTEILEGLAKKAGYTFRARDITAKLLNPVLVGSPIEKAKAAAKQAGLNLLVDDGALILLPEGQPREGSSVTISKETGMIGYPSFSSQGITLKTYYNPALIYNGSIRVESIVKKACGTWRISKLSHFLSACQPNGPWQSEIEAVPVKVGV